MSKYSYIRKYYPHSIFATMMLLCVLTGSIPALQIIVEQNLLDAAILGMSDRGLQAFVINMSVFIILMLINSLFATILQFGLDWHTVTVGKKLDAERLEKVNKISFPITETQGFHELYGRAEKISDLDSTFYSALQAVAKCGIQISTSFAVLFTIDKWTAGIVFVLLIIGIWINQNAGRNTNNFWGEYIQNMRHANYLSSLLLHREYAAERKIFHYNQEIEYRYQKDSANAMKKNSLLGKKRLFSECATTVFAAVYSIAAILLLVSPLENGKISLGSFIAAFTAIIGLRNVGNQLYGAVFDASSSFAQMSAFFSFLQLDEDVNHSSEMQTDLLKGIEFRNVSFTYPGTSTPVLEHISFTWQMGMHYALVGENGCGKTTLVKLLLGLYKPTEGCILVGGKDVSEMSREEKRQLFSAVFQDFYRYPLSIRENVSLGSSTLQESGKINSVLHSLNFDAPCFSQDKGVDITLNLLKQESVDLSGGEWQKLTVARSILSSAPIVVLDEPNAALDPMSEMAFYRVYEETLSSKTTLFISHRLGAVKTADCIMVLRNKRLIAMDSHTALMKSCEYYRELFETQRGMYYETNTK